MAFGGIHFWNPGENWIGLSGAALIGLFFCLTLRRTGNLWFAVGFHAAWDWGESFSTRCPTAAKNALATCSLPLFTVHPGSPEARLGRKEACFCFLVIALVWVAFDKVYRQAKYR